MKILITGSSGYIGTSLKERLGKRFSFVDFDIKKKLKQDVRDKRAIFRAVSGVHGIIHLAAVSRPKWGFEDPYLCLTTNILGTINILEAVKNVNPKAWIILASSREVFGNLGKLPATEKSPRAPLNAYGVSKFCGEELLSQYANNYGLKCLTLRFCGVYTGKNDILDRVVPKFIRQAIFNKPIMIEDMSRHYSDYVYIDDVVSAVEKSIKYVSSKKKGFYDSINLVSNNPVSLFELAKTIVQLTGSKSKIIRGFARSYDQGEFWGSNKKAEEFLKWRPKISLKTGLEKSIKELKPVFTKINFKYAE